MKVLIGSGNPGKLSEMFFYLRQAGLEPVSGMDYTLEVSETGSSPLENARLKAAAYSKASGLPCVAFDSGMLLLGIPADDPRQPGTHVRRIGEKRMEDEEMIAHYQEIARSLGGRVQGQWVTGFAAAMPDGRMISGDDAENQPNSWKFWLVEERSGEPLKGKPLSCISLEGDTGRYVNADREHDGASAQRRKAIYLRAVEAIQKMLNEKI
ncbi:MAG: non-canonical purine NTP pyrophosphatase [Candidatus Merdivicinus sp.]|jgi:XTP/dITP diphosphohydrolase